MAKAIINKDHNPVTTLQLRKRLEAKGFRKQRPKVSEISKNYFQYISKELQLLTPNITEKNYERLIHLLECLFKDSTLTTYQKFLIILPTFDDTLRNNYFRIVRSCHNIISDHDNEQFRVILDCIFDRKLSVLQEFYETFDYESVTPMNIGTIDHKLRNLIIALDDPRLALTYIQMVRTIQLYEAVDSNQVKEITQSLRDMVLKIMVDIERRGENKKAGQFRYSKRQMNKAK